MMIVYQNIIASSLADPHAGILPQLLPEAWAGAWWLSQHVVGALVLVLLLIPLCCLRCVKRGFMEEGGWYGCGNVWGLGWVGVQM